MNAATQHLHPGDSVDMAEGYVARSYSGSCSYYAERLNHAGEPLALSPNFPTFALAAAWLAS